MAQGTVLFLKAGSANCGIAGCSSRTRRVGSASSEVPKAPHLTGHEDPGTKASLQPPPSRPPRGAEAKASAEGREGSFN